MKKTLFLLILFSVGRLLSACAAPDTAPAPVIHYALAMPQPQTHYFEVTMHLQNVAGPTNLTKNGYIDLKMPVWTPGSYLIREYARHVEGFAATAGDKAVRAEKIRKNTWRIYTTVDDITVRYKVYANDLTVRTSFVDSEHGYVTPASMFLFHDALKSQPLQLTVTPYKDWKTVTVALQPTTNSQQPTANSGGITPKNAPSPLLASRSFSFDCANFDLLVDSPIEIGNQHIFNFTASGVPHRVAMFGIAESAYDQARLAADYKRVCETTASVIGEHPCTDYTFIVHHIPTGGGGLEHLNSTVLETYRNPYLTDGTYKGFLTLVAHEYFHLWNVKRIRPVALGPFDYETENYTTMLWWAEGVTSFYEDYILRRAGFHTPDQYLRIVAGDINNIENQPGVRVQPVAESSFDAWIKGYRPDENSPNSTISYYSKGSVVGTLLNLAILSGSNGKRNLDDLLRLLYNDYYKGKKRGFTDAEFQAAASQIAGQDLTAFFQQTVNTADAIDYNAYFEPVGLRLINGAGRLADGFLGATVSNSGGKAVVSRVRRDSAAWTDGLNVGDEVISVDNIRVSAAEGRPDDFLRQIEGRRVGDTVNVLVNRGGILKRLPITLTENPLVNYQLQRVPNPTPQQQALYNKWLFIGA
jgi:predicted metalloprotease with PDZ domain